jgi:FtsP/CotA-like multicopper oxidase with cupredoxin domain
MSHSNIKYCGGSARRVLVALAALACAAGSASAATPGITASAGGASTFNLVASQGFSSQPDGAQVYSWGYGCASTATYTPPAFAPLGFCPAMQLPGPTLVVNEGTTITVTLTNNLPQGAGNTSIVFSGFTVTATTGTPGSVTASGGTGGLLAQEAIRGGTVTYTINTIGKAGTHAYYSGSQPDLQIEMGMFGALVVIPTTVQTGCVALGGRLGGGEEYRLWANAYDHPATCYDREYLFQFSEMDPKIHAAAEAQVKAIANCTGTNATTGQPCPTQLFVPTEPYKPAYYLINGRSMPDDMDADYAPNYPAQPYNGNPHMHPLDQVLIRVIGQGRWEHPFHEHANHVRILARDGNLMLAQNTVGTETTPRLAGLMMFTTDTFPGQSFDGIFYWSGKGLNWDIYGHTGSTGAASATCTPDANGYYTNAVGAAAPTFDASHNFVSGARNYGEWCADHNHPLEAAPVGQVAAGGPATLPDPLVATNGLWYNGTPYLGPDAVVRSRGPTPLPVGGALQNPLPESGIAFMWHSHNEREITTNDVFPGGMLMMMLVDPPVWFIDETL